MQLWWLLRLFGCGSRAYAVMGSIRLPVGEGGGHSEEGELMRRLLIVLLMVLVVSASSCDGSSDAFDFSSDDLCEWFSDEEIT